MIYFYLAAYKNKESLSNKINAIAGGLLVVLGYDLVDYGSLISYIRGTNSQATFTLDAADKSYFGRNADFRVSLVFWKLYKNETADRKSKYLILSASLLFALAIMSYFFSWGIILSFWGFGLFSLFLKIGFVEESKFNYFFGILFSAPYLYNIYLAAKIPYTKSQPSEREFLRQRIVFKQISYFGVAYFPDGIFLVFIEGKRSPHNFFKEKWWLVCLAMITCGFIALNQLLTGQTVWPYHLFSTLYH